ncbi:MAG: cation:proton antiporter [Acidimicrobiales bacterium mtb01]|nr:cation:proton antiporter [Actinomycetota bacterium]TEX47945.1 MAG: cation:proton antiporter [Acidimicrobiales bacterium mtb01]
MKIVEAIALGIFMLAALITVFRIVRRSTLGDRAVAFDLLTAIITSALLVTAARGDDGLPLDLALLLGLIGFLTSITVARFIEARAGEEQ